MSQCDFVASSKLTVGYKVSVKLRYVRLDETWMKKVDRKRSRAAKSNGKTITVENSVNRAVKSANDDVGSHVGRHIPVQRGMMLASVYLDIAYTDFMAFQSVMY